MHPRAGGEGIAQHVVLSELAVRRGIVDPDERLGHYRSRAKREMTHLQLPICPSGSPTLGPDALSEACG